MGMVHLNLDLTYLQIQWKDFLTSDVVHLVKYQLPTTKERFQILEYYTELEGIFYRPSVICWWWYAIYDFGLDSVLWKLFSTDSTFSAF